MFATRVFPVATSVLFKDLFLDLFCIFLLPTICPSLPLPIAAAGAFNSFSFVGWRGLAWSRGAACWRGFAWRRGAPTPNAAAASFTYKDDCDGNDDNIEHPRIYIYVYDDGNVNSSIPSMVTTTTNKRTNKHLLVRPAQENNHWCLPLRSRAP